MSLYKQAIDLLTKGRDKIVAHLFNESYVPVGLSDLNHYFRTYGAIHFRHEKQSDGSIVAISSNFRYGTIITHAQRLEELDEKVKDAVLTSRKKFLNALRRLGFDINPIGGKGIISK